MKRSEMVKFIAEQLFYRDLASEHQFWFREEDRPNFEECDKRESYLSDSNRLLIKLEELGMFPPLLYYSGGCPGCSQCDGFDDNLVYEWEKE